ncbi:MAG TPA: biopolymer transporter ExbD [Tepidisphaeraceae bacterium]|nr:biopolymer transporter ExbD [Tepidisphaeraceae bacterium]
MRAPALLRNRGEITPNMTPLVDVVMVILIFLMLAGSFAGTTRFLRAKNGIVQTCADRQRTGGIDVDVIISPTDDGGYIIHAGKIITEDASVLTRELSGECNAFTAAGTDVKQVSVVLRPSSRVRYDQVIEVYQAAMRAGFSQIKFARANS